MCVCEMLIRHECCGVGAPRSGGGTPCATSLRAMEALVSCSNYTLCVACGPWKHEAKSSETGRVFSPSLSLSGFFFKGGGIKGAFIWSTFSHSVQQNCGVLKG